MSASCPIQSRITLAKEIIEGLENRIKAMEERITQPEVSEDKKKMIETELVEIKKLLNKNTEELSNLHKENSKSFVVAVIIFFLCFLIYGVYVMFINE